MQKNAIIGANSQGGGRRVGDDVLVGGMPFVKSGDCTDPEIRENHAKALVVALELGSKATRMLVGMEKTMEVHQTKVCLKLGEIQADLKTMQDRFIAGDQALTIIRHEAGSNKKDLDGLGKTVRDHMKSHVDGSKLEHTVMLLDKHLTWHQHVKDVEEDRKFQLFNSVRVPVLRWFIISIVSLALLGAVITAFTTIVKVLPSLEQLHHLERKEKEAVE